MSEIAIHVEDLSKQYRIGQRERYKALRDTLTDAMGAPFRAVASVFKGRQQAVSGQSSNDHIWALKDVSLEIKRGEVVGIIGRNGGGKTTLLKILSRITEPTNGYAEIRGRVGSLLEVGTGFHPELTGRENIYLNGAILGMKKAEIERKFDEIVTFSEIDKFIDTPVKHYSSGMFVRLAFAVAAHMEPQILLVDEVLAVGDAAFQKKCLGKMGEVSREGRTVLFVSHSMAAVLSLCGKAYLLEGGRVACHGAVEEVVGKYMQSVSATAATPLEERVGRKGDGKVQLTSISIQSGVGSPSIRCSDRLRIRIGYTSASELRRMTFLIRISDQLGRPIFYIDSGMAGGLPDVLPASGFITCATDPINITPGSYIVNLAVLVGGVVADHVKHAYSFEVGAEDFYGTGKLMRQQDAICLLRQEWQVESDHRTKDPVLGGT